MNSDALALLAMLNDTASSVRDAVADIDRARRHLVRRAIDDGATVTEVADAAGISRQRVGQLLQDGGER